MGNSRVGEKPRQKVSPPFYGPAMHGTAMDLTRAAWRAAGRKRATSQPLLTVHRIDKDTSGLLAYAKNKAAERALAGQFREHTAERTPLSPASIAMKKVVEPKQWTTICTESRPVISRTLATAAG